MRRHLAMILPAVLALVVGSPPAPGDTPAASDGSTAAPAAAVPPDRHPDLVRLSPTEQIWIDRVRKEVVVGGRIAVDRGAIEVFACPARTKEHESIVAVDGSARLVHAALLAVGIDPGRPVAFQPVYRPAQGPPVSIRVRWRDAEGQDHECRGQDLVRDARTGAALDADWVFTGSEIWRDPANGREHYQADCGDLVCVSNFPTATLDLPIKSSQSNDALLFEAFAGRVPPVGTAVEIVLSAKR